MEKCEKKTLKNDVFYSGKKEQKMPKMPKIDKNAQN